MTPLAVLAALAIAAAPPARAADPAAEAARSYRLETAGTTQQLRTGETGTFVISIVPLDEVHVHPQAPLQITLDATPGLELERTSLGKADPIDPNADGRRFEVSFVARAAGAQEARAKVEFFICSDHWCVKQAKDLVVPVRVR
jgi:hypothetical protein